MYMCNISIKYICNIIIATIICNTKCLFNQKFIVHDVIMTVLL